MPLGDTTYVIEARPELATHLASFEERDFVELLLAPVVLTRTEGATSGWRAVDHSMYVTLLFLAGLREYVPLREDADFARWFGSTEMTLSLFHQWWSLRRLEAETVADEALPLLKQHIGSVPDTGNPLVDARLEQLRHG